MTAIRRPELPPFARAALPCLAGVLVYATFEYTKSASRINQWDGIDPAILRSPEELTLAAMDLSARIGWGAACLVFLLCWAVTVTGTVACIASATRRSGRTARACIAGAGLCFLVAPLVDLRGSLTVSGMTGVFDATFVALEMNPPGSLLMHLASALSVQVALLLSLGAGVCLVGSGSGRDAAADLEERMGRLRLLLYLGAAFLISGTVENLAMHHLPVALVADEEQQGLRMIAQAVSAGTGTFWTVLLFAIYLPPALMLRTQAARLAKAGVTRGEARDSEEWLKVNGLSSSITQQVQQLLALLGPFLVGVPGSKVLDLLASGA